MSLLSRLSLLQKFAVLALVGLFVAAWPTYLHVRDALRTIDHARMEASGAAPLTACPKWCKPCKSTEDCRPECWAEMPCWQHAALVLANASPKPWRLRLHGSPGHAFLPSNRPLGNKRAKHGSSWKPRWHKNSYSKRKAPHSTRR